MNETSRITFALPWTTVPDKETRLSRGSRATAAFLGVSAMLAGVYLMRNQPNLARFKRMPGWTLLGIGSSLIVASASIRQLKPKVTRPTAPDDVIATMPDWLADVVRNTPHGYYEYPDGRIKRLELQNSVNIIQARQNTLVHLRLQVAHSNTDASYDRGAERASSSSTDEDLALSSDGFLLEVFVVRDTITDSLDRWVLRPVDPDQVQHRNAPFNPAEIVGDRRYFIVT